MAFRSVYFLAVTAVGLSVLAAVSLPATNHLALLAPRLFAGDSTPHMWNIVTCHFFDASLLRLAICLPLLLGIVNELDAFHTPRYLWPFFIFVAAATGLTAFVYKIVLWLTIQDESFFYPSASLFALLGASIVAYSQALLPSSVSPGAALMPLPGSSSTSLPPTPVSAPPLLLVFPIVRFCADVATGHSAAAPVPAASKGNARAAAAPSTDQVGSSRGWEFRFVTFDLLNYFCRSPTSRPLLRQVDSLPWKYCACAACCCLGSQAMIFFSESTAFDISVMPRGLSFVFDTTDFIFALAGCLYAWLYLRFLAFYVSTGQRGDVSVEFSFPILFPHPFKPVASRCSSAIARLAAACGMRYAVPESAVAPRMRNSKSVLPSGGMRPFPLVSGASAGMQPLPSPVPTSLGMLAPSVGMHYSLSSSSSGVGNSTPAERALRAKGLQILERHIEQQQRTNPLSEQPALQTRGLASLRVSDEMISVEGGETVVITGLAE